MAAVKTITLEFTGGIFGSSTGRVTFAIFRDASPKAVENLKHLVEGGGTELPSVPLLKGSCITRVSAGESVEFGTSATKSVFGGFYETEAVYKPSGELAHRHDVPGVLSVNNYGPNTNASKYIVSLRPNTTLDGHHVILGCVSNGMDVLHRIANARLTPQGVPKEKIVITASRLETLGAAKERCAEGRHIFVSGGVRRRDDEAASEAEAEGPEHETSEQRERRFGDGAVAKRKRGEVITADTTGAPQRVTTSITTAGGEKLDALELQHRTFTSNIDEIRDQQRRRLAKSNAKASKQLRFASKLTKSGKGGSRGSARKLQY